MAYIIRRLLAVLPVMGFVALFVFVLLRLAPGDPAAIIAGNVANEEQLAQVRNSLGLDEPLPVQFFTWLGNILQGDFGVSIISGLRVTQMIGQRLESTITLALLATLFTSLIAVPLGVVAAWKHRMPLDHAVMLLCVLAFSVPIFVSGYVLVLIFGIGLHWFPVEGYRSLADGFGTFLGHLALPVVTASLPLIALVARMTRASMLDILAEDHVRTAHAKGLGEAAVLTRHALRNAAPPIVTVIGNSFALLIGGIIVTETIFNLPGVGRLMIDALLARDYPVIQGIVLLTSAIYVALNLIIDLIYVLLDPRVRY